MKLRAGVLLSPMVGLLMATAASAADWSYAVPGARPVSEIPWLDQHPYSVFAFVIAMVLGFGVSVWSLFRHYGQQAQPVAGSHDVRSSREATSAGEGFPRSVHAAHYGYGLSSTPRQDA